VLGVVANLVDFRGTTTEYHSVKSGTKINNTKYKTMAFGKKYIENKITLDK